MFFKMDLINIGDNSSIIEIVDSDSGLGCLKKSNFKNNLIVCLPLQLSFGDLKTLDNYNRSCLKELHDDSVFEEKFVFKKEIEELKKYVFKAEKIRVWSSHKNADEFLLFLYICSLFPEKNISVVFADEYNPYCWSISCMDAREINKLVAKEHILSSKDKQNYINMFQKIVDKNSELRYMKNKKIESVSIDYFDEEILTHLKELGEVSEFKLIGNLMVNFIMDSIGDYMYLYLINRMIEKNKIKVVGIDEKGKRIIKVAG